MSCSARGAKVAQISRTIPAASHCRKHCLGKMSDRKLAASFQRFALCALRTSRITLFQYRTASMCCCRVRIVLFDGSVAFPPKMTGWISKISFPAYSWSRLLRMSFDAGIAERSRLEQFLQEGFEVRSHGASQLQLHADERNGDDWFCIGACVKRKSFASAV